MTWLARAVPGIARPVAPRVLALIGQARPWMPVDALNSIRLGLTVVASVYLAMAFELERPEWAAWTVLSVSLTTRAGSLQKSTWRALGTIVGAAASLVLVGCFAQDTLAFDIVLAVWLGLATAGASLVSGQSSYGFSLIGFTVPIITLSNVSAPMSVFDTAVDRCSALLLGIVCAHVSAALVAPGVPAVEARLAAKMDDATAACAAWLRAGRSRTGWGEPPVKGVLTLDTAVADAYAEQPSLRVGGHAVAATPGALLAVLGSGMLEARIAHLRSPLAGRLLGWEVKRADWRLLRARAVARILARGGRIGLRRAPAQPLPLDRDGRLAFNNGLRTAVAVSLTNAFWYFSEWPSGGTAVTFAALVSALLAARDNAAKAALDFLLGAALAYVIGIAAHYIILTSSGAFGLLAAVILPIGMMGAMGRFDSRAVISGGFGITVFTALEPLNVMQYDLAASLNGALASLLGIGTAVLAFSSLPPPASPATRHARAKRRMVNALHALVRRPRVLLPKPEQWCAPMFERLALIAPDGAETLAGGKTLMLVGLLMLALRASDEDGGRRIGKVLAAEGFHPGPEFQEIAAAFPAGSVQALRAETIGTLLHGGVPGAFPGVYQPA